MDVTIRLRLPAAGLSLSLVLAGCSLVTTTVDLPVQAAKAVLPGGQETAPVDPIELQEDMLRYADNLISAIARGAEKLERDHHVIHRSELLTIKVALASDVYGLATGSNALANLVGLTLLSTGARIRVEDYWQPRIYGRSADLLLKNLREREKDIWTIAERVLTPEMITELHEAIENWHQDDHHNPHQGDLETFASNTLISDVTKGFERNPKKWLPSSVFALFDIDPLAGLDPATRELTETRLFAERALFMGQRLPQLIEWQMELLALRSVDLPEVSELLHNTSVVAGASERFSKSLESLPDFLAHERERVLAEFKAERQGLKELADATRGTFEEGSLMARNTEAAVKTYGDLARMIHDWPSDPASPPFDIRDWEKTAVAIGRMSSQVETLLNSVLGATKVDQREGLEAGLRTLTEASRAEGERLINHFVKMTLLLLFLAGLMLMAFRLGYLWLLNRLRRGKNAP